LEEKLKSIFSLLSRIFSFFLGSLSWSAPPWLTVLCRYRKKRPAKFWISTLLLFILVVASIGGFQYYQGLPKPIEIIAQIYAPDITPNSDEAKPEDLVIEFVYDQSRLHEGQERPNGPPSVARIDLINQIVEHGISMRPALTGQWLWDGDRTLVFSPDKEWPAGTEIQVNFDQSIFTENVHFHSLKYSFFTPEFSAVINDAELYQDPTEKNIRRVISTLVFSHPVDSKSLEEKITLSMRPSGSSADAAEQKIPFTVKYDKNQREAYVQSDPISLPDKTNYMQVSVAQGVKPATGGEATKIEDSQQVLIPDIYSFLKISETRTQIVRNEKQEPQQVLTLNFTDDIETTELLKNLTVYLLPKINSKNNRSRWSSPREVTPVVLKKSTVIDLNMIPNPNDFSKNFNFIYDVPENRYLYVHIKPGLKSVNNFVKATLYDHIVRTPTYPKELNIMGEGSMLSLAGAHQLSFLARGIDAYAVRIGRLLPNQLNHLVSQTGGDISHANFRSYSFDQRNIVEYAEDYAYLEKLHPKEANYAAIDLSSYLPTEKNRFGLFFVEVIGWDSEKNQPVRSANDSRVILVTDLGLLVKDNVDQSHDVFVQSISAGKPVARATVELLGRNGLPLFTRTTDNDGHVTFPSTQGFEDEQSPNSYIVKTASDISFIPFQRSERDLNYSQFNVGGVRSEYAHQDNLKAYIFSDRGLYRPGETVELGCIIKDNHLGNIEDIPLEISIQTPRGAEISNSKLKLSEKGLINHQFISEATSETGTYQVYLYLIRDNQRRGRMLGSATFRIEEFQPDTLKIESKLENVPTQGWTSEKNLHAKVRLENLFGTPAQDRKVTGHLTVSAAQFKFQKFKGYTFTDPYYDPTKRSLFIEEDLKALQTDQNGIALFEIPLERFDRGTYQLEFQVEGFDPGGGRSVIATNKTLLSPLSALLGYKSDGSLDYINKGTKRNLELLAITPSLDQVALENLKVRLIEVQNISTLVKQYNGTYKYQTVKREKPQETQAFNIAANGTTYPLPTATPGEYILEILDADKLSLARVEFNVVGHGNLLGKLENNAELQLKLNRKDYKAGDLIEMSITAPYTGSGLITIESDRVHTYKWFQTKTNSTLETIRVPQDLEGNAYVNVAFVRDAGSKEIFTSPLSYAIAPFTIDRSKRQVEVQLDVAPLVRPGKPMAIGYKTSKPTKLIVFAVNEGILQVANYQSPRPLDHFLEKQALEVNTSQILDLILPEFDLVKEVSARGGGYAEASAMRALAKNLNPFARTVDTPAVFWSGIIDGDTQPNSVEFDIPDTFSGNLRVMAVAVADEAIGVTQTSTLVRGPFVITPSVLTQAAPGDQFKISASVANVLEGSGKQLPVTLHVSSSQQLEIIGATEKNLKIDENGEQRVEFDVKVKQHLGPAEIIFRASSGEEDIRRTVGLSIRPSVPYRTTVSSGYQTQGTVTVPLQRQLYTALSHQNAAASQSPLVLIDGLSTYLENFPHGCTEQIVSQVFPLLGLMGLPAFESQSSKVREQVDLVVQKLRQRQLGTGGFSFWPGSRNVAEFPSVYAMHFLIEAQDLGFAIPSDLMTRGHDYLRNYAHQQSINLDAARTRAYSIYLLARMGDVITNDLVNVQTYLEAEHQTTWRTDLAAVYMAAAYNLLQKDDVATDLAKAYQIGNASWESFRAFNSPLTQDAQYLYLLSRHFPEMATALDGKSILHLVEPIFTGRFNTISAAYSILALGTYSKMLNQDENLEEILFTALDAAENATSLPTSHDPFPTVTFDNETRAITIKADDPLFYMASQAGYDLTMPQKAVHDGLEISRAYYDDQGNKVTQMEQGKEVTARIVIRALGKPVRNIAVVDLLPGGFEVIRDSVSRTEMGWNADYIDIREDRVVFYGDFDTTVRELSYRVKVTASGSFIVPAPYAESMYDRSVHAGDVASNFKVIASQ
jgi:uncharacterized protein YfaS (alpha-2-macroglobulin family)